MTLRARLALTLALLAGVTAIAVVSVGYRVTSGRLNQAIDSSLSDFSLRLGSEPFVAQRICGVFTPPPDIDVPDDNPPTVSAAVALVDQRTPPEAGRRGRQGVQVPVGLSIQCINSSGTVFFTGAGGALPVEDADRAVASGNIHKVRIHTATVEGTRIQIRTVPVLGLGAVQVARSLFENDAVLGSLLRRYVLIAVGATFLAAVAGLLLARRTARPIVALTNTAERIASTGDLSITLAQGAEGGDETNRLAHAFGTMLEALRRSRDQQARLVQDAGHELRTPLTSLRTNVSLLQRADLPEGKRAQILTSLREELVELTDLTNELVALAANANDTEAFQSLDLAALAARGIERCERRTGRSITAQLSASDVDAQPAALARVIDNLLGNATKFTPPNSPVELSVTTDNVSTTLTVRDHGPGIDPADLAQVFERFYRATSARTLPGSGLGLAIVHDTVMTHGGSVTVANHCEGGAMVTVVLPNYH